MAHFAKIENGTVTQVNVIDEDYFAENRETRYTGQWVQTSYNTRGGVHYNPETNEPSADQSKALRKNYAGIGYVYDEVRDAAAPVTLVAGDAARLTMSRGAAAIVKPFSVAEAGWNASLNLTTTTAVAIQVAGGASLKRHITAIQAINTGAAAVDLIILDGATERWRLPLPINVPLTFDFPTELVTTAATALNANLSAVNTGVRVNAQGYTSA